MKAWLLAVALAACAEARGGGTSAVPATRFVALGDSFTIGTGSEPNASFPARLSERWRKGCSLELRNVAVNGYTTEDVISEELGVLQEGRPAFVTIAVGANDIVRGRSIESYRAGVQRILRAAIATGAKVVTLPQPKWNRSPVAASFGDPNELGGKIEQFNAVLAEESRAAGAQYVELTPLMERQATSRMLARDGLHPSSEAYDEWASALGEAVASPCPHARE